MYNGTVFNKITGKPMQGVPVCDGRNIAFTDKEGKYTLCGWESSNTVSVQLLTENHDDWFHYTGGTEGQYDFYITPVTGEGEFSILHTSDTEIDKRENVPWIPFARECAKASQVSFMVHTGDICREGGLRRHKELMNRETIGCPVRYVLGNHDTCAGDYGEQIYEQLYGPVWYSFDYSDVHFIVLSIWGGEFPSGYTMKQQLLWLDNDIKTLAQDKKVIMLSHDEPPIDYTFNSKEKDYSVNLKKCNLIAWIFGHIHTSYHFIEDGVHNISTTCPDCGGIDSSAAGLRTITIGENIKSFMTYNGLEENKADKPLFTTKLWGNCEFSELQLFEGDIIAATMRDALPSRSGVYRINAKTGDIVWFFETEGGVRSDVSIYQGRIYALDAQGNLYCLNAQSGKEIWKKHLKLRGTDFTRSSVLTANNMVYTGTNKELFAFDIITGEELWNWFSPGGCISSAKPVYNTENDCIVVGNQWYSLNCVDAKTGKQLWVKKDILVWHRNSTPTIEKGIIYTCSESEIGALDIKTGEIIRRNKTPFQLKTVGAPAILGDTIFFPTATKGVAAFDKNTLELIRLYPTGHARLFTVPYIFNEGEVQMVESSPVIMGDTLVFTGMDGVVYFYDIDTARLKKKIVLKGPSLVKPLIEENNIYTVDFFGNLSKYSI